MFKQLKDFSSTIKREIKFYQLVLADPRTPRLAKMLLGLALGYLLLPFDLIPDFIPVLGYLDDLILVPLGITLALKMIPKTVWDECREEAQKTLSQDMPRNWVAAGFIIAIWILVVALVIAFVVQVFNG